MEYSIEKFLKLTEPNNISIFDYFLFYGFRIVCFTKAWCYIPILLLTFAMDKNVMTASSLITAHKLYMLPLLYYECLLKL